MKMRLMLHSADDAFTNMAIDGAILKSGIPTLRLYSWKPAAISIGYFQSLEAEVDTGACKELGVDIVRRQTGGGAVFHDDELTYSLILPEEAVPDKIIESYEKICGGIVKALENMGFEAKFSPVNDILVDGRKVSGNAQTRKHGNMLQHGTILLDTDVDRMFRLLKVPDEKMRDKIINNVKERVIGLRQLGLGDVEKLKEEVIANIAKEFGARYEVGTLTRKEREARDELLDTFSSNEWNHMR